MILSTKIDIVCEIINYLQLHVLTLTINVSSDFRPKGRKRFALFNFRRNRIPKG